MHVELFSYNFALTNLRERDFTTREQIIIYTYRSVSPVFLYT
jgi:hypothetical protein